MSQNLLLNVELIEQKIKSKSTITDAINELSQEIPSLSKDTLYNIILSIIENKQDINLTDDYNQSLPSPSSNNNGDQTIANVESSTNGTLNETELSEQKLQSILEENKRLKQRLKMQKSTSRYYRNNSSPMNWKKICHAIEHEMSNRLAIDIKKIIDDEKYEIEDENIGDSFVDKMINILSSDRKFEKKEETYLKGLIHRAKKFEPNERMLFQLSCQPLLIQSRIYSKYNLSLS